MWKTNSITARQRMISIVIICWLFLACGLPSQISKDISTPLISTHTITVVQPGALPQRAYSTPAGVTIGKLDCEYNNIGVELPPIAFSADGKKLACSKERKLALYQLDPLKLTKKSDLQHDLASLTFSLDGNYLAVVTKSKSFPDILDLYDANNGNHIKTFNNERDETYEFIAFSPDSTRIALLVGGNKTPGIIILDRESEEIVFRYRNDSQVGVAFSVDGKRLYVASQGTTTILDTNTWKNNDVLVNKMHIQTNMVTASANGIWVHRSGGVYTVLRDDEVVYKFYNMNFGPEKGYAISADGKWFAAHSRESITICDLSTGEQIIYSRLGKGRILKIAFTPQGKLIGVSANIDPVLWEHDFRQ
jgi:WD40 repeat protein